MQQLQELGFPTKGLGDPGPRCGDDNALDCQRMQSAYWARLWPCRWAVVMILPPEMLQHVQLHILAGRASVVSQRGESPQPRQRNRQYHFVPALTACARRRVFCFLGPSIPAWHDPKMARRRRETCDLFHQPDKKVARAACGRGRPRRSLAPPKVPRPAVFSLAPRTRSSRTPCGKCDRELRVQKGH